MENKEPAYDSFCSVVTC